MYKIYFTDPKLRQTFVVTTQHQEVALKYTKSLKSQGMVSIICQNQANEKVVKL
jgi:hypothetical protein